MHVICASSTHLNGVSLSVTGRVSFNFNQSIEESLTTVEEHSVAALFCSSSYDSHSTTRSTTSGREIVRRGATRSVVVVVIASLPTRETTQVLEQRSNKVLITGAIGDRVDINTKKSRPSERHHALSGLLFTRRQLRQRR